MKNFTEAYLKAREVLERQQFAKDWDKKVRDLHVVDLLDPAGPNLAHATALDRLREDFSTAKKRGRLAKFFLGDAAGETILEASTNDKGPGKQHERAATLKMLKHFYFAQKRGGQDVWIYSPPKSYRTWIFDEVVGNEQALRGKLSQEREIYTPKERQVMCDALSLALNWSLNAERKLADGKRETKDVVRRWFADGSTTDAQLTTAMDQLREGFKKIAAVANSNRLIFSDEPLDRNNGGWKDWAFVYRQEKSEVVYLQGAFLKAGNSGKLWMCALTIIHELSHRTVGTDDHAYDSDGLKPSASGFNHGKALDNADSWAYFATDLAGMLSAADRDRVLR